MSFTQLHTLDATLADLTVCRGACVYYATNNLMEHDYVPVDIQVMGRKDYIQAIRAFQLNDEQGIAFI